MARVEPVMEALLDDIYVEYLEKFGRRLVDMGSTAPRAEALALMSLLAGTNLLAAVRALPLPGSEQDKLIEFFSGDRDYLDDLSLTEKQAYVGSVSYAEFLTERVGLSEKPPRYSTGTQAHGWARRFDYGALDRADHAVRLRLRCGY